MLTAINLVDGGCWRGRKHPLHNDEGRPTLSHCHRYRRYRLCHSRLTRLYLILRPGSTFLTSIPQPFGSLRRRTLLPTMRKTASQTALAIKRLHTCLPNIPLLRLTQSSNRFAALNDARHNHYRPSTMHLRLSVPLCRFLMDLLRRLTFPHPPPHNLWNCATPY